MYPMQPIHLAYRLLRNIWLIGLSCCSAIGCGTTPQKEASAYAADDLIIVAVDNAQQLVMSRAGSTLRGYDAFVPYNANATAKAQTTAIARDYGMTQLDAWPIKSLQLHCVVYRIPSGTARSDVLNKLASDARVALVQPLQTFDTLSGTPLRNTNSSEGSNAYNDPYFPLQNGLVSMEVANAHRWTHGKGVRIAVIDTGMDTAHPDLKGRIADIRNFVDHDAKQFSLDQHGTEVAGVIAANLNNREGIVGVAPSVELIALKACWQLSTKSAEARCNSFTLAQALGAAIDMNIKLVNLSVSGPTDRLLDALLKRGQQQGMIFVGAVAPDGVADRFPISTHGVLAADVVAHTNAVPGSLPAPGNEVLTLTPNGHYDFASGSSIATAHVTGAVALLLQQDKRLTRNTVEDLLKRSIQFDPSQAQAKPVNVCSALRELTQHGTCSIVN
jgi:hypothetical protein